MKIFLTGASGLVGSHFARAARRRSHQVIGVVGKYSQPIEGLAEQITLDLQSEASVQSALLEYFPDAIVNAAALSRPADCDKDPDAARSLNTELPRTLAQIAHHLSARLVHLSTDMVFDGQSSQPYHFRDPICPDTLYGKTKAAGEAAVQENAPHFSTLLRLPLLTGDSPRGHRSVHENLFHAWKNGEIPAFSEQEMRQPTSASNVAEVILEILERNDVAGTYHWAGKETLSRFELAHRITTHFGLPTSLIKSLPPSPHKSPKRLTFTCTPLLSKLKTLPATLEEQFDAMTIPGDCRDWFHHFEPNA